MGAAPGKLGHPPRPPSAFSPASPRPRPYKKKKLITIINNKKILIISIINYNNLNTVWCVVIIEYKNLRLRHYDDDEEEEREKIKKIIYILYKKDKEDSIFYIACLVYY